MSNANILDAVQTWGVEYTPEGLQELENQIRLQRVTTRDPATRLRLISYVAMIHIALLEV